MEHTPKPHHQGHEHDTSNIEMLADMIDASDTIRQTHRSCILRLSQKTHRMRFMRFPDMQPDSAVKFWTQHVEEISQNEFVVRNFIIDEEIRPLLYQQFFDIHAEATDLGAPQPSGNHVVTRLFQMGQVNASLIDNRYRFEGAGQPDIHREDFFRVADEASLTRIYEDTLWLRENLFHH